MAKNLSPTQPSSKTKFPLNAVYQFKFSSNGTTEEGTRTTIGKIPDFRLMYPDFSVTGIKCLSSDSPENFQDDAKILKPTGPSLGVPPNISQHEGSSGSIPLRMGTGHGQGGDRLVARQSAGQLHSMMCVRIDHFAASTNIAGFRLTPKTPVPYRLDPGPGLELFKGIQKHSEAKLVCGKALGRIARFEDPGKA